jgi:hypothetical protein
MAEGGFVVKINGKELCRCYAIAFDYDEWEYTVNDTSTKPLPKGTESISIDVES